ANIEPLAKLFDHGAFGGLVHKHSPAHYPVMRRHTQIDAHSQCQEQRLLFAVLRQQADPVTDGILGRADPDLATVDEDATGMVWVGAEDRARHFSPSGAD